MEMTETELQTSENQTTTVQPTYKYYTVELDRTEGYISGTITVESSEAAILEQLKEINTNQTEQLELLQTEIEIQQNLYTVTSYLFVSLIAFALINLFSKFFNSVITY